MYVTERGENTKVLDVFKLKIETVKNIRIRLLSYFWLHKEIRTMKVT